MPTERLSMRKIRDVLRLKFESGVSERVIARSMSLSNGSVNAYLQRARVAGLRWPLPDDLDREVEVDVWIPDPYQTRAIKVWPHLRGVRLILALMAGTEWIPDVAGPHVTISKARGAHNISTAEWTISAILASLKYFPFYFDVQRSGQWKRRFESPARYAQIGKALVVEAYHLGQPWSHPLLLLAILALALPPSAVYPTPWQPMTPTGPWSTTTRASPLGSGHTARFLPPTSDPPPMAAIAVSVSVSDSTSLGLRRPTHLLASSPRNVRCHLRATPMSSARTLLSKPRAT